HDPLQRTSKAISAPATCSTLGIRSSRSMRSRSWSCISRASAGVTSQGWRCRAFILGSKIRTRLLWAARKRAQKHEGCGTQPGCATGRDSGALFQFSEDQPGHLTQRLEHAFSLDRHSFHARLAFQAHVLPKRVRGHDVGEIALVELQHIRNGYELDRVFLEMLFQIIS